MKLFFTALLFVSFAVDQKQPKEIKLEGTYRMEYETEYASENCMIQIKKQHYKKTRDTGVKIKGNIEEVKLKFGSLLILKDKDSELEAELYGQTYNPSDTIYFRTKKVNEKENNEEALVIYSARLIKVH